MSEYPYARRHCPHVRLRGIYGDEANHSRFRLECLDCTALLDGPVVLEQSRRSEFANLVRLGFRTREGER